jgi:splicing factor 3A subunit 1
MVLQGLIRPPPEIRVVADRTALYVAKNGRTFETRILNSAKGQTPKFAFLHATSPFHAYYEDRIQFYEKNGGVEEEAKESTDTSKAGTTENDVNGDNGTGAQTPAPTEDDIGKVKQTQKASAIDPISKALLTQRTKISEFYKKNATEAVTKADPPTAEGGDSSEATGTPPNTTAILPPPPPLSLVQIVAPASLSIIQLETIQITAQLIAISSFVNPATNMLQELTLREWNNPIFRFCQPRHGHFAYFSALVDAYKQILSDWSSAAATTTLSSIKNTSARIKEMERMANNVDRCLEVTAYRAEYQRDMEERLRSDEPSMANKVDWHDFVVVETIDFAIDEVVVNLPPPTAPSLPPASIPTSQLPYTVTTRNDSDMEDDDDDDGEMIRVVPSYTPKISGATDTANTVVVDPISGKSVAVKDMPEHMRIQLLDPKWAEERKKFQEKQKESNLVSGDMVASNLERFAQARGDRFGKKVRSLLFIIIADYCKHVLRQLTQ